MRGRLLKTAILSGLLAASGCQPQVPALPAAAVRSAAPSSLPAAAPAPAEPSLLTWDQLDIGIPAESKFEPWMMTTWIKSHAGQRVRITGYMHAGIAVKSGIREFILLRNIDCPYGRQGEAHHVMVVGVARPAQYSVNANGGGVFRSPHDGGWQHVVALKPTTRVIVAGDTEVQPPESVHNQEGGNAP
jgi:hypothetical protein